MRTGCGKIKGTLINNKWILIALFLTTLYVFSNYFCGYKVSFSNVNYYMPPYNSYNVDIEGPLLSDIADSEYPLLYKIFYEKDWSLWDNSLAMGTESNSIAELINPMKWVYFLPFELAILLKCFSEFAIAFFSVFLFTREIGVNKYAASISGIVYAFSSVIVAWLGWAHSDVAAWAPLLFWAIEKLISTLKTKYMFIIAAVIYMMLIVGMPTYTAYFLYLAGIYIVVFTLIRHWKNKKCIFIVGGMFAVSVILATVVSLPYTYTLLESVMFNGYAESREVLAYEKLDWGYLKTFIFPYLRDGMKMHFNESTLYVGTVSILCIPLWLCNNKNKKRNLFFVLASVVLFILIFTGVLDSIYKIIPLINTSLKIRVITLLMFTMAVLTGITLSDIMENKEYYQERVWIVGAVIVWIGSVVYLAFKNTNIDETEDIYKVIWILAGLLLCILLMVWKKNKIICAVFACLVLLDSASFARDYIPWIEKDAEIIPEASEAVSYLMQNTNNEERVLGLGTWMLFPNTPSYYGLNDVRIHGFVATNRDMEKYYEKINENAYTTRTRIEVEEIENYELLKYMGVKYIYGHSLGETVASEGTAESRKVMEGAIESNTTISQELYLQEGLKGLQILFATYGTIPENDSHLTLGLRTQDGVVVYEKKFPISQIGDNLYLNCMLDNDTLPSEGMYVLSLEFGDLEGETITVWMNESLKQSVVYKDELISGSLVLNQIYNVEGKEDYNIVYVGNDSVWIGELHEYSDKVELAENVFVCNDEDAVLSAMEEEYIDNSAFVTSDSLDKGYSIPLTDKEGIELLEYKNDYVKMQCTSEYDRYVILNDYYNKNWNAYVNGEKTSVEKVNYLMRGVKVTRGEDIVIEFKYEPTGLYIITGCAMLTLSLSLVLFFFRTKLQEKIEKL